MTKFVYLAGPIFGVSYKEANDWREDIKAKFLPGIVGISPMRLKSFLSKKRKIGHSYEDDPLSNARAIKTRDYMDVKTCDMLLAWMPKALNEARPSTGTTMELGWADAFDKPIVLVTDDPHLIKHPLTGQAAGFIVPDLDSAAEIVNGVFGEYVA